MPDAGSTLAGHRTAAIGVVALRCGKRLVRINGIPHYILPGPSLIADAGRQLADAVGVAAGHVKLTFAGAAPP